MCRGSYPIIVQGVSSFTDTKRFRNAEPHSSYPFSRAVQFGLTRFKEFLRQKERLPELLKEIDASQ